MQEDNLQYLFESYTSLLLEEVMQDDIIDAIKKKYEVAITYDNNAKGYRIIEPVVYGKTLRGNLAIRAYQPYGDTETKKPAWKTFRVDRIMKWEPMEDRVFNDPPPMYNGKDDLMSEIYIAAKFDGMEFPTEPSAERTEAPKRSGLRGKLGQVWDKVKGWKNKLFGTNQEKSQSNLTGISQQTSNTNSSSVQDMSRVKQIGSKNTTSQTRPIEKGKGQELRNQDSGSPITDYENIQKVGPVMKNNGQQQGQPDKEEDKDPRKKIEDILNEW